MKIKIELFASLRLGRFQAKVHEYPSSITVSQVVRGIGVPDCEIGIVLLNGQHASLEGSLKDGDTLALFPLVGGG